MENNQIFPFERNRYYPGKLLTSADFQAEQEYMNHKRAFVNSFMLGDGIVCGLSVFNLDDFSIMVESGIAIDAQGREIVIENSEVKKLSAIEGFEGLKSNTAALCLRYREEEVHPVYVVDRQEKGNEYENNRIREGYELFLLDKTSLERSYEMESEFFTKGQLYSDADYSAEITMPSIASCGKPVKVMLRIKKHTGGGKDISLDTLIQTPGYTSDAGLHQLEIHTGSIHLEEGKSFMTEYWLMAQHEECAGTDMIAKSSEIYITCGGKKSVSNVNFSLRTAIQPVSPEILVTREIGKVSLEMRNMGRMNNFVPLAYLSMLRTDNAYMIDGIDEAGVKRYIPLPAEENLRTEYASYYKQAGFREHRRKDSDNLEIFELDDESAQAFGYKEPMYASGVCEIPLKMNARKGLLCYSGEIMHGLGTGNVYVQCGIEYLRNDVALGGETRHTIYGLSGLFKKEKDMRAPAAELAVRVSNDKGSFVAAARLLEDTQVAVLNLRWVAIKLPGIGVMDKEKRLVGMSITADTPTVVLEPGDSHYFNVQFKNMEPCSLSYRLMESGSGEITREGIYTAPSKEGIYEICIACAELSSVCTYVYAVVKKQVEISTEQTGAKRKE